jgi:hypothetical protein
MILSKSRPDATQCAEKLRQTQQLPGFESSLDVWARYYRDELGLCAIPLMRRDDPRDDSGNKRPLIDRWQDAQLTNNATIDRWFPAGVATFSSKKIVVTDSQQISATIV